MDKLRYLRGGKFANYFSSGAALFKITHNFCNSTPFLCLLRRNSCSYCPNLSKWSAHEILPHIENNETYHIFSWLSWGFNEVLRNQCLVSQLIRGSTFIKLPEVNFINILLENFLYKNACLHSFSLVTFWLCNFLAQNYWCKSLE